MPLVYVKEPKLSDKISRGLCICVCCNNKAVVNRKICHKHINHKYKEENPISYALKVLKCNAKRRNIEVLITKEEFEKWCIENNYIENKGIYGDSYTIDRKFSHIGYTYENMQVLSNSKNVKKMLVETKMRMGYYPTPDEIREYKLPIQEAQQTLSGLEKEDDCPF